VLLGRAMGQAVRTGNAAVLVGGLGTAFSTGRDGGASGYPITLSGPSYERILAYAETLADKLLEHRRVRHVDLHAGMDDRPGRSREFRLRFRPEQLAAYGLDAEGIARELVLELEPAERAGLVEVAGRSVPVTVSAESGVRSAEEWMERIRVRRGVMYRLSEIAELRRDSMQAVIHRINMNYERTLEVTWLGDPHSIGRLAQRTIAELPPPVDVRVRAGFLPQGEWSARTRRNALLIFGLGCALVWMVLCALLESWSRPVSVMASVPFALIGVMAGMLVHGLPLDRGTLAGSLLSVGVCVNNAILLTGAQERLRRAGVSNLRVLAHVYTGSFRAIAATSCTTLAGLLPMVLLEPDPFWTPFALVVLWGLGCSSLLQLLYSGIGLPLPPANPPANPPHHPLTSPPSAWQAGIRRSFERAGAFFRSSASSRTTTRWRPLLGRAMRRSSTGTPPPTSGPDPHRSSE